MNDTKHTPTQIVTGSATPACDLLAGIERGDFSYESALSAYRAFWGTAASIRDDAATERAAVKRMDV